MEEDEKRLRKRKTRKRGRKQRKKEEGEKEGRKEIHREKTLGKPWEKTTIYKVRREASEGTTPANTLIIQTLAFRTGRK